MTGCIHLRVARLCLLIIEGTLALSLSKQCIDREIGEPQHFGYPMDRWENVDKPVVPTVSPFQGEKIWNSEEEIFFDPQRGYSFPANGQGGNWNNLFYTPDTLRYVFVSNHSLRIFSKEEAATCLASKWVHIDGDSVSRDMFYDLNELFGMEWGEKEKSWNDQEHIYAEIAPDSRSIVQGKLNGTILSFGWDPSGQKDDAVPSWYHKHGERCPDVWVYTTGLWDHTKNNEEGTSFAHYTSRMKSVALFDHSCVKKKVLKYTTPYAERINRAKRNTQSVEYNRIAKQHLEAKGFLILDVWSMLKARPDLTKDGVHYTGPGSKWTTNSLLNLVC
eukprot:gnl/TRDRNA2_/TRDRNA2_92114_c0_seq1.p1 gnl/TRDRNA2_/TRDRNA2_92114_c0~~gnl/TRDRNA2_/TRDRNA2_92114_c0_seq1.p1  ORF type:complete len:332 (+),score=11.24 gnl/TRDRNA2_/TRDRNA2_92114_c0_seq1:1-996(+)